MDFNALNGTGSCNSNMIIDMRDPTMADQWIATDSERFVVNVIIPVISAVGVFGNAAFTFMIFRLPELRTSLNAFLVNLAVCDITFLLLANIWGIFISDIDLLLDVKSAIGCAFYVLTTRIGYYASLGIMTIISMERFYAICKPLQHRIRRGGKRTFKILLAIWIVTVLMAMTCVPGDVVFSEACVLWPPMEIYKDLPTVKRFCDPINIIAKIYEDLMTWVTFVVAFIINFWLYVRIILALQSRPVMSASGVDDSQKSNADRVRNQVARTLILNGVVFFLCQIPFRVYTLHHILITMFNIDILGSHGNFILNIGHIFLFLNSIINPFLYILSSQFYRQSMIKAFGFGCSRISNVKSDRATSIST